MHITALRDVNSICVQYNDRRHKTLKYHAILRIIIKNVWFLLARIIYKNMYITSIKKAKCKKKMH